MNYIVFAEKCLEMATQLYKTFASSDALLNADGLLKIIDVSLFVFPPSSASIVIYRNFLIFTITVGSHHLFMYVELHAHCVLLVTNAILK